MGWAILEFYLNFFLGWIDLQFIEKDEGHKDVPLKIEI